MTYFGMFKQLKELQLTTAEESDLYRGGLASIYEALTEDSAHDLEIYARQAAICGSPVLELACGTGRVMLELARLGHTVTGLDLSGDMLDLLAAKLDKLPNRVRRRVSTLYADMTSFRLPDRYRLILLPATSLCLLHDEEAIERLFANVYEHLADGGRFVFDFTHVTDGSLTSVDGPAMLWTGRSPDGGKQFIWYGERKDYLASKATVNFYSEIETGGETRRIFGYTVKKLFTKRMIDAIIRKTGFEVVEMSEQVRLEHERVDLAVLEKRP